VHHTARTEHLEGVERDDPTAQALEGGPATEPARHLPVGGRTRVFGSDEGDTIHGAFRDIGIESIL
jgi:hypothetical protein